MSNSLRGVVNCGLLWAILDLIHGLVTIGFYGYEAITHYRCHWNHGIRWCQYYLDQTNHSLRVNIGIGEGLMCVFFASLLITAFSRFKPWLTWVWLIKALAVLGINGYFITIWVIEKSRYYHSFWDRSNYDQDNIFLMAGVGLTLLEFFITMAFCCVSATFTHRVRKQQLPTMETDI